MNTTIASNKIVILSDLHLGNPVVNSTEQLCEFIRCYAKKGYDICINGDAIDIAQFVVAKLVDDVPSFMHALKIAGQHGSSIYYIVGNHDIILEHFFEDWGGFEIVPFLNIHSGEKRIRVEHGHLYDPFFIKFPALYFLATWLAGWFLKIHPSIYKLWIKFEQSISKSYPSYYKKIAGEHPNFALAGIELSRRGFDAICLGHTHYAGQLSLSEHCTYYNSGSWIGVDHCFLLVEGGNISIQKWSFSGNA